ncbi:MAG: hypothetical protein WBZ29_02215 [Methanocella sp.]
MTIETHAIIMTQGEDLLDELHKNLKSGNLITKVTEANFRTIRIEDVKYVRIADPHETDHHDRTSIWVEATITF